jgi:hypothetical protein
LCKITFFARMMYNKYFEGNGNGKTGITYPRR